jgi:hypothetical protein
MSRTHWQAAQAARTHRSLTAGAGPLALALIAGAILAGCGSSSTGTDSTSTSTTSTAATSTVKLATVQDCLQKAGYTVHSSGAAKAVSTSGATEEMNVVLEAGAGKKGTPRKREGVLVAEQPGAGHGEATIAVFLAQNEAEESASEARSISEEKSRAESEETPAKQGVLVSSRANVTWIVWTGGAATNQAITSCVA